MSMEYYSIVYCIHGILSTSSHAIYIFNWIYVKNRNLELLQFCFPLVVPSSILSEYFLS